MKKPSEQINIIAYSNSMHSVDFAAVINAITKCLDELWEQNQTILSKLNEVLNEKTK